MLNPIRNLYILPQPDPRNLKIRGREDGSSNQGNHRFLQQRKAQKDQAEEEEVELPSGSGTRVNVVA